MMKATKWGIIGCGDVVEVKSGPAFSLVDGFELHAVMRRNAQLAQDFAKRHGVPQYYSDAQALINDPEVDAVYIATPPDAHQEYAIQVAKAGKICCIEKPMANDYQSCVAINQAFESRGLPLFVAYYRRSLERFQEVKKWISEGEIGTPRHVHWQLSQPASDFDIAQKYQWRTDERIAPGGYFDDLASHGIDFLCYLLGSIKEVNGLACNQQQLYKVPDAVVAHWQFESGVTGTGAWNFGSFSREDKVKIYGAKGVIECAIFEDRPFQLITQKGQKYTDIAYPKHIQYDHLKKIQETLATGVPHPSTGKSAAHTAWVMEAILRG
ncbi:Gfo/Idh/MocA family oxidoreductase [Persicobacter diffluens]|uniref:Oxidoreductase n=1 Tax=Persicobacter diffluens TaxID=981 RepID=A0AAN4W2L1_9BACT|nr:oxidoreductase [Persicobacter diffluens]